MPNTIQLKAPDGMREEMFQSTGAAIKPGNVVIRNSSGKAIKNNLTSGTDTLFQVAIEDALQGKTINDAYADDAVVFTYIPETGDILYLRIPAGAGAIVQGDRLQFDNTGCLIKQTGSGIPKAVAREDLDNSGGGSEAFLRVEVI